MRLRRLRSQAMAKVAKLDTISDHDGNNSTYKLTAVAFPKFATREVNAFAEAPSDDVTKL